MNECVHVKLHGQLVKEGEDASIHLTFKYFATGDYVASRNFEIVCSS